MCSILWEEVWACLEAKTSNHESDRAVVNAVAAAEGRGLCSGLCGKPRSERAEERGEKRGSRDVFECAVIAAAGTPRAGYRFPSRT